jgi:hypothetical protein
MNEERTSGQVLSDAKARRNDARDVVTAAVIRASADAAELVVCKARVGTLEQARAAGIAAAKPADVIAVDDELPRARIACEIAASRAATSTALHDVAVTALRQAEAAVARAAHERIGAERIELALEFETQFDHAMEIGGRLQMQATRNALNRPINIPLEVERASSKLPRPNPLNVPLNVLRGGGGHSDVYTRRLVALTAESIE